MTHSKDLRIVTLSDSSPLHQRVVEALKNGSGVPPARVLDMPGDPEEITRLMRVYVPEAVLAPCADREHFGQIVEAVRKAAPGIQIIAYRQLFDSDLLLSVMRIGVLDVLAGSFDTTELRACLARVADRVVQFPIDHGGTEHVFSFVPAKAGAGATTLALNVAAASARFTGDPVFLGDFDANAGVVRFLLNLRSRHGVFESMDAAGEIDSALWDSIIEKRGNLEVAHSGVTRGRRSVTGPALVRLLQYLRRRYGMVCCDLPETNDEQSIQIMRESKETFLVVTPDPAALYLAMEKGELLKQAGFADRLSVIVNRLDSVSPLGRKDIESVVGIPVKYCLGSDYRAVAAAASQGSAVRASSALGQQYETIARALLGLKAKKPQTGSLVESVLGRFGKRREHLIPASV